MKKLIASKAILLAGLAFSASSYADVTTRLRSGLTVLGNYEVSNVGYGNLAYDADYTAIPIGITVLFDSGMYADLAYQSSSGDASFAWSSESPDFSRSEVTATVGTRMKNFSAFLGYKQGETETDWPAGLSPDVFESAGFVFGVGYSIPLNKSAISITGGLGLLTGEYTFAPGQSLESDATFGYSFGLGYNYVLGRNWSVGADYKWNSYDYEFVDGTISEEFSQVTLNVALTF